MHKAADKSLVDAGVHESATVGVAMTMGRCTQRLAHREANALAGRRVGLVVLSERVHGTNGFSGEVDEGKGVVALTACHLFQIAVPQL